MTSAFGFSTDTNTAGDFLPILKYDARAGRLFRIDRVNNGQGFDSIPTDISGTFRALTDFDNVETGWIDFQAGSAPSFVMIRLDDLDNRRAQFPDKPSATHKAGIRFMCKLTKDISGDSQVREIAGVAKTFLSGVEEVYNQYKAERGQHPGELPVLMLDGTPMPVKTGSGEKSSTNYKPKFKIIGWAPRGDLKPMPRGGAHGVAPSNGTQAGNGVQAHAQAPNPGSTPRPAPQPAPQAAPAQPAFDAGDFG